MTGSPGPRFKRTRPTSLTGFALGADGALRSTESAGLGRRIEAGQTIKFPPACKTARTTARSASATATAEEKNCREMVVYETQRVSAQQAAGPSRSTGGAQGLISTSTAARWAGNDWGTGPLGTLDKARPERDWLPRRARRRSFAKSFSSRTARRSVGPDVGVLAREA